MSIEHDHPHQSEPDVEVDTEALKHRVRAAEAERDAERRRSDHAVKQRDLLAIALRDVLDAHYYWREVGEGKEGHEADFAAQGFIDARTFAQSALAQVPAATLNALGLIHRRIMQAAVAAHVHAIDHDHEGVHSGEHFFATLLEKLTIEPEPTKASESAEPG